MTNNSIFGGAPLADSSVAVAPSSLSGAYNKRVCGSLRSPKPFATLRASHTRWPLYDIGLRAGKGMFRCAKYGN